MLGWARAFVRLVHIDPWPLEQHDDTVKVSFGRGVVQRLAPGHAGHQEQQHESLHTRCGPHTGRADWAGRFARGCRVVWALTLAHAVAAVRRSSSATSVRGCSWGLVHSRICPDTSPRSEPVSA
eukprot:COSAG06_NODE_741_length_12661_cov_24.506607_11_plen_124_part_00